MNGFCRNTIYHDTKAKGSVSRTADLQLFRKYFELPFEIVGLPLFYMTCSLVSISSSSLSVDVADSAGTLST